MSRGAHQRPAQRLHLAEGERLVLDDDLLQLEHADIGTLAKRYDSLALFEPHPDDIAIFAGCLSMALIPHVPSFLITCSPDPEGVTDSFVASILDDGRYRSKRWKRDIREMEGKLGAALLGVSGSKSLGIDLPLRGATYAPDGRLESWESEFESPTEADQLRIVSAVEALEGDLLAIAPAPWDPHQHHRDLSKVFLGTLRHRKPGSTVILWESFQGLARPANLIYKFGQREQHQKELLIKMAYPSQEERRGYARITREIAKDRARSEPSVTAAGRQSYVERFLMGTV